MDYQSYEDYMRQILGYSSQNPNIYEPYNYEINAINNTYDNFNSSLADELYPDIYHVVYPMVCKVCENNNKPITKDLLERMTDEVYYSIEDSDTSNTNNQNTRKIETEKNIRKSENNLEKINKKSDTNIEKNYRKSENSDNLKVDSNNLSEDRQIRRPNFNLRDLIKILILRELLGQNRPPMRPPHQQYPPRPPYPRSNFQEGPYQPIQQRKYPGYL